MKFITLESLEEYDKLLKIKLKEKDKKIEKIEKEIEDLKRRLKRYEY